MAKKLFRKKARKKERAQPEIPPPKTAAEYIGKVIVAPEVLATVARKAVLGVRGVSGMSTLVTGSFNRLLKRAPAHQGVRLEVKEGRVALDIYLVAKTNVNLQRMGEEIQNQVSRDIQELVGMPVETVNVHIEEIEAAKIPRPSPAKRT
ncbi:MAG: Asp23/Gls24 family envelope stress response protein [Chloroflexi bacterium]|nr:Asp23/Gls24 family envelope stress response protein [Chloroflexota bacterium]